MMKNNFTPAICASILVLAACGNDAPPSASSQPTNAPAASAQTPPTEAAKQVVSKEEVELAWKCRGIMSAVAAYQSSAGAQVPAFAQGISVADGSFWTIRAANLTYDGMTDEAENALIADSVIVSPDAIEQRKADIEKCVAAKNAS